IIAKNVPPKNKIGGLLKNSRGDRKRIFATVTPEEAGTAMTTKTPLNLLGGLEPAQTVIRLEGERVTRSRCGRPKMPA
ncbi:MAG: hypothetical protein P8N03_03550, partial [Arenicellales bacterium]|nr:hypothetical protein [Arenicellales bacterium]